MAAGLALLASEPVSLEDKRLGVFGPAWMLIRSSK
jgi:hypothetical protein